MAQRVLTKDLDIRLSILETKHDERGEAIEKSYCVINDKIEEVKEANRREHENIDTRLSEIQTHIAKQNGALPYIKEAVREIKDQMFKSDRDQQDVIVDVARISAKTKFILSGAGVIVGAILGHLVPKFFS